MPQAAVGVIATYLVSAGVSAALATFIEVFVYVAATYLLNRAAAALTPRRRSSGLGGGNVSNYFGPVKP